MKPLTIKQIEKATAGRLVAGDETAMVSHVEKDSRAVGKGYLFVPIIGDNHDAHSFIPQCLEKGCRSFLISDERALKATERYEDANVVLVKDTTTALQDLAAYYLDLLNVKTIAVTGSTGKTSTRDFIYSVCKETYNCKKTVGNFNNLIGMPMTIFTFEEDTQVGVIEMGMDRFGEIRRLAEIARPDIGVITNIGIAHIEYLGSREGIFQAKMELTERFDENNLLIVSTDEFLNKENIKGNYPIITTGEGRDNEFVISAIDDFGIEGIKFTVEHEGETETIELTVPGAHNALNATLAVAVGTALGISMKDAADGLAKAELTGKRLSLKEGNGIKVIDDTYNASPASVMSAIDTLTHSNCRRRVAILGDMYELGPESKELHQQTGEYAARQGTDLIIAIGRDAEFLAKGARESGLGQVLYYKRKEDFIEEWKMVLKEGDLILIKGSRGMEMEKIVEAIVI